jgi:hypothetical protein
MMGVRIDCQGCCRMLKDGVEVYRCDQTGCLFWTFAFGQSGKIIDTCFT